MTKDKESYVVALTKTADQMLGKAIAGKDGCRTDPSAEEIATEHFKGFALSGAIIEDVRKQLPRIRTTLERDFGRRVYLLSRAYYRYHRNTPNAKLTEVDAKSCVPGMGHGVDAHGLRLHNDEADKIFTESMKQNTKSSTAKTARSVERLIGACADKRMALEAFGEVMEDIARDSRPSKPGLVKKATEAFAARQAEKKQLGPKT